MAPITTMNKDKYQCKPVEIIGHHFLDDGELLICEDCGLSLGKEWYMKNLNENKVLEIDLRAPIGKQIIFPDGTKL